MDMSSGKPVSSPWMVGAVAPVFEEVTANGLEVQGAIPAELTGRFIKIGPNPVTPPKSKNYRAFMAAGMVHGVRLREGRAEWYRNRWVRSKAASRTLGEGRVGGPRHSVVDSVNTHVIGHAGQTLALVEGGCTPAELSFDLDTRRYTDFEGTLPGGFSAHPKKDPYTGELHAITYRPARRYVQYVVLGTDARVKKVAKIPVPATPIMHDMALTENYVILFDSPARMANPMQLFAGKVYRWNPSYPARFGVLPRNGDVGEIRWFDTDPCFILHTINAYEEAGRIIVDGMRYDRIMDETLVAEQRPKSFAWRWTIDLTKGTVAHAPLDDIYEEFPRIDDRRSTLKNRFSYTLGLEEPPGNEPISLIKRELETGKTEIREYRPGVVPSEAVFVPRQGGTAEDDGWIMTYVTDLAVERTDFVIYHAQALTSDPVAVVKLPVRVPIAFHGSWIPDDTGSLEMT
jgi:carotenoid cleavage dioxygenase